jgi:hypothetical protein
MDLFNSTVSPSRKTASEKFAKQSYLRQQTQKVRAWARQKLAPHRGETRKQDFSVA